MNENVEFQKAYRSVISIALLIIIIVSAILLTLSLLFNRGDSWFTWNVSYLLGGAVNLFAFNLLKNNVANITADAKSAISGSFSNYAVRMMIYAFIVFISLNSDKLNVWFVIPGFLSVRIAIYIYSFLKRKE